MENFYRTFDKGAFLNDPFKNDRYSIFHVPLDGWVRMEPRHERVNGGWKFHLSVHPHDVEKAWNIVAAELLQDKSVNNHYAKAADPEVAAKHSNPDDKQAGKMIVIGTDATVSPKRYRQLIERIEAGLQAAGVRSGPRVKGDRQVPGGAYTFYRNDKSEGNEYNAASSNTKLAEEQRYNPFGKPDPYKDFEIDLSKTNGLRGIFKKLAVRNKQTAHPQEPEEQLPLPTAQQLREMIWTTGNESADSNLRIMSTMIKNMKEAEAVAQALTQMGLQPSIHGFANGVRVHIANEDISRMAQKGIRPRTALASQNVPRPH